MHDTNDREWWSRFKKAMDVLTVTMEQVAAHNASLDDLKVADSQLRHLCEENCGKCKAARCINERSGHD